MVVEKPILDYGELDLNGTYTYFDYLNWQFPERVELIRGKVFKLNQITYTNHQLVLGSLAILLTKELRGQKDIAVFMGPLDIRLPVPSSSIDSTVVQPDICIICNKNKLDELSCNGAPDLVVEILAPGNTSHELNTKFKLYEESGVKEYWIIESFHKTVFVYTLVDANYIGLRPFTEGMQVQSPLFPDLAINVDAIFEDI